MSRRSAVRCWCRTLAPLVLLGCEAGTTVPRSPVEPGEATGRMDAAVASGSVVDARASAQPVDAMVEQAPPATLPDASSSAVTPAALGTPTLFWLDIAANRAYTASANGAGARLFASGAPLSAPDGVTVDPVAGHVFVLNMGSVLGGARNGSLVRYGVDGGNARVLISPGTKVGGQAFDTGKQVTLDATDRKLYLADREGSKVWRCDLDGANLEVLVSGHGIQQIVGVGVDPIRKQFYFSDRNGKKLYRAGIEMPVGKSHGDRDDLELLYVDRAANAMPLDVQLDLTRQQIFWTDRQQDAVFRMAMQIPAGADPTHRSDVEAVMTGLVEVVGIALDQESGMLYATHSGTVSSFTTDGQNRKDIGTNGSTGISFTRLP